MTKTETGVNSGKPRNSRDCPNHQKVAEAEGPPHTLTSAFQSWKGETIQSLAEAPQLVVLSEWPPGNLVSGNTRTTSKARDCDHRAKDYCPNCQHLLTPAAFKRVSEDQRTPSIFSLILTIGGGL